MSSATAAARGAPEGPIRFLKQAVAPLNARRLLLPILLLGVLLTASNIVILLNAPVKGHMPGAVFIVAALVRVLGLMVMVVGLSRLIAGSPRRPWMPDGAFWLSALSLPLGLAIAFGARRLMGGSEGDPLSLVGPELLAAAVQAPFAAWLTAIAVEKPLAWRPSPWFAGLLRWLPAYLLWTAAVTPLVILHAMLDFHLIKQPEAGFWPIALVDGPLSLVVALAILCLNLAAYRSVAHG
ncbi:MAG: hypothetical protein QOJ94_1668 [Sphingomonadales bacterium]|jgi:hypothetical protein|nr:hypothetical protein [Sphingomonadales bacterium]